MKHLTHYIRLCAFVAASLSPGCIAAETPRIGLAVSAVGPLVDVTLKSGETNKGQLLSFAEGSLSLRLENGSIVTQDGASVVSVRFIVQEKPPIAKEKTGSPSAQETELNLTEIEKLNTFRWRDNPPKGMFAPKQPPAPLSDKEKAELTKLRAKADIHIKALEVEASAAATEEAAQAKLHELGRYYYLYGLPAQEIRSALHIVVERIKNDAVRVKVDANFKSFWETFVYKHKNYKPFEKIYDNMMEREKPPVTPEKPPIKPPADGNK